MAQRRRFRHNTIAMVYDFDGTLTPQPMQEYTILPKLGVKPNEFWKQVREEASRSRGDEMLIYMRLLIEETDEKKDHLSRGDLRGLAKKIKYYPGVEPWFARVARYVEKHSDGLVQLHNYVISAGQKEILESVVALHAQGTRFVPLRMAQGVSG